MSYILDQEKTWSQRDFGLDRRLIKALSKLGFIYPTLVQAQAIPLAIQGKDCCVRARTGSGKTIAFALPLLHKLLLAKGTANQNGIFGIILAPTKELCKQIQKNINDLLYYCRDEVKIGCLVDEITPGGTTTAVTLGQLDIIITTPAKLVTNLNNKKISIANTKMLVIDEADLILSFGYAEDVQVITSHMPKIFQGILMSATLSPALDKFKRIVLNNPVILKLEEPVNTGKLLQFYLPVTPSDKYLVLYVFLKLGLLQGKGLIFVNDIDKCYRLKLALQQFYINSAVLNAEMPLNSRLHIIDEFNRGVFDYLIATDASVDHGNDDEESDDEEEEDNDDSKKAKKSSKSNKSNSTEDAADYGVHRGLDFQEVNFVVNFDFPMTSAAYTHRVGRTARAGASGTALSFVCSPSPPGYHHKMDEDTHYRDHDILQEVQSQQPRLGTVEGDNVLAGNRVDESCTVQPSPLVFNMKEIESFRYRVEDTVRGVTTAAVRELRAAELKKEILNSEKLKSFFTENPNDFKVLRHDKSASNPLRMKDHLRVVPSYLIPTSMQSINTADSTTQKKKKRKVTGTSQDQRIKKSKMNDPLRNLSTQEGEGGGEEEGGGNDTENNNDHNNNEYEDDGEEEEKEKGIPADDRVFTHPSSLGHGISGRKAWKMRHGKGKFNPKGKKNPNKIDGTFSEYRKKK